MDSHDLKQVIYSFFGGSERRVRHPLNRRFIYTEGVDTVAQRAGAYWLLDIIATECVPLLLREHEVHGEWMLFVYFHVSDGAGVLELKRDENEPTLWSRDIDYTDFPAGDWLFYLSMDGVVDHPNMVAVALLPSEY